MVFEYYNEFYKNVYDEKAYEKAAVRLPLFLDAASDGTVPPTLLPGAKKSSAQSASGLSFRDLRRGYPIGVLPEPRSFWTAVWRRSPCAMI